MCGHTLAHRTLILKRNQSKLLKYFKIKAANLHIYMKIIKTMIKI